MALWLLIGGLAAASALWLLLPLLRRRGAEPGEAARAVAVYRAQLDEIARDLARGLLAPGEAEASRTEVARRLLAADAAARAEAAAAAPPGRPAPLLALALALLLVPGAILLYLSAGAPGQPDQPLALRLATRPGQAEAEAAIAARPRAPRPAPEGEEARFAALVETLKAKVADRPDDLQGHRLLAGALGRLGDFPGARAAQARVVALMGETAGAQERLALAEFMILAAEGYVSPEAEAEIAATLRLDPSLAPARYYAGLAAAQTGRYAVAWSLWTGLLAEGPPDAPWIPAIRSDIARLAAAVGEPPPPGTEAAAPEVTPEAIRGMVEGLASRLAAEGGPAADWARLIRALAVLGDGARAGRILAEAEGAFAADPDGLALIRATAAEAGVTAPAPKAPPAPPPAPVP